MNKRKPSLLALLMLMPFGSICAVLFTPSLPEIAGLLNVSDEQVEATMTLFLVGYALGSLPYGPIAKRFGRKPAIYSGIVIAVLGSILILFAGSQKSLGLFLVGRFLTALGSAVGMKISFTIIADVFKNSEATKALSLATMAFAIAPGLAVGVGGFLTTHFGWQSCFYALILYSFLLFGLTLFQPETASGLDKNALNFREISNAYARILKNKNVIYASLILGCVSSIIYLFSTLAPFLAINQIGLTPEQYGYLNFIPPVGLIAGSFASHWLAERKEKLSVIRLGGKLLIAVTIVMLGFFAMGWVNLWTLFLPIPVLYFATSLVFNNASSFAMEHMKDKSTDSAMMSFVNMAFAAFTVLLAQSFTSSAAILLPTFFLCLAFFLMLLQKVITNVRL